MSTLKNLALCLGLLLCGATAGPAEILIPRDKAAVAEDTLVILGTAPKGSRIPWELRGSGGSERGEVNADWGDLFEIFLVLSPGINRIRVGERELEVFCSTGGALPPPGFSPQTVHAGDVSRCQDCHELRTLGLLEDGYPGACLGCHVVVPTNPKYQGEPTEEPHFAVAIAGCGSCHEPHTGIRPKLLRDTPERLCGRCHPRHADGAKTRGAHGAEGCSACHDPHVSGYPNSLRMLLPGLCQQCHEQGSELGGRGPHPPLAADRSCAGCHDAHGAGPASGETKDPCSGCHARILASGHKERLGGCAGCHDPHRPLGTGLLSPDASETCLGCHPRVAKGRTIHGAMAAGCQGCHTPHGDGSRETARASCRRCHDLERNRELRSLHGDLSLPPESCDRCHPPHASESDRLIRGKIHAPVGQGKCAVCHGGGDDRSTAIGDEAARCRMCHPFEAELRRKKAALHPPFAEGRCTECHDPHVSPHRALLRVPEPAGCERCHSVPGEREGGKRHPAVKGCTDCHAPHGAEHAHLARAPGNALCKGCHEPAETHHPLDAGGMAKYPDAVSFPRDGSELGCLGCHAPHASRFGKLLARPQAELCATCHPGRR